jgi:GAF domain-containing protein
VDAAGALLQLGKGEWHCVSELDTPAESIELFHTKLGEGPAIEAAQLREVVRVPDVFAETRWPHFIDAVVARTPVRSLRCLPLYTHIHTWGALTLLSDHPNSLDAETEQVGVVVATHMALTLESMHHDRHYRSALGSRDIIGQAKGILMERFDIDAGAAFALLTELAHKAHRPVVVIAKDVLDNKIGE